MASRPARPVARLTQQVIDLSWASPMVIAYRLAGIALAGPEPDAQARREVQGMIGEKLVASQQAWLAICQACWSAQWQWLQLYQQSWLALLGGNQARAARGLAEGVVRTSAGVASAGLEPYRRKAVANARRLSRSKRR